MYVYTCIYIITYIYIHIYIYIYIYRAVTVGTRVQFDTPARMTIGYIGYATSAPTATQSTLASTTIQIPTHKHNHLLRV